MFSDQSMSILSNIYDQTVCVHHGEKLLVAKQVSIPSERLLVAKQVSIPSETFSGQTGVYSQ